MNNCSYCDGHNGLGVCASHTHAVHPEHGGREEGGRGALSMNLLHLQEKSV